MSHEFRFPEQSGHYLITRLLKTYVGLFKLMHAKNMCVNIDINYLIIITLINNFLVLNVIFVQRNVFCLWNLNNECMRDTGFMFDYIAITCCFWYISLPSHAMAHSCCSMLLIATIELQDLGNYLSRHTENYHCL